MKSSKMKDAPWFGGWVIAAAAGLVAAGATYVIGDFNLRQAVFVGVAVLLAVGLFIGIPRGAKPGNSKAAMPADNPVPVADAAPVPVPAMAEAAAPAVSFVSEPAAAPAVAKKPRVTKPKASPAAKSAAKPAAKPAAAPSAKAKAAAKPKKPKVEKPAGPVRLTAPRRGKADDLKEIEGIGPALEKLCNALGFYHFDQIASWSDADVALVDAEMKTFKGRIARDKWVAQAKIIVTEGLEAFRVRAQTNNY